MTEWTKETLSVALCTWNGETYLQEQLDSIAEQTRQPDELVVCDDDSTDGTIRILHQFRETSSFPVSIFQNEARLGPAKNFEKAIFLCSGELIALSDQDDVWLPQKLGLLEAALLANPAAGFVFCDAIVVNGDLAPLGHSMWERVEFGRRERRRFLGRAQLDVLLKRNRVSGGTMAFRSVYRGLVLPIPDSWLHDAWIAMVLSATGHGACLVEEPLVLYRQHPAQVCGGGKHSLAWRFGNLFADQDIRPNPLAYKGLLGRLNSLDEVDPRSLEHVAMKSRHMEARHRALQSCVPACLLIVAREVAAGRYRRYSNGWQSVASDLVKRSMRMRHALGGCSYPRGGRH